MSVLVACDRGAVIDSDPNVLARIWEPEVHLSLWQRPMPDDLVALSSLEWDAIDDIDEVVAADGLADALPLLIEDAGYGRLNQALSQEIGMLAARFAAIMDCGRMRLRLEVIETDACRRFHADNVAARLLMPLVGPGTQWIHAGTQGPIAQLRPGEVGLFKGRLWAEEPRILHRSPPVAASGETRLLFALNPALESGPE